MNKSHSWHFLYTAQLFNNNVTSHLDRFSYLTKGFHKYLFAPHYNAIFFKKNDYNYLEAFRLSTSQL